MNEWLTSLIKRLIHEPALVRVMVVATRGSVPREAGAWMLVGTSETEGTIGGGHLEWKAEAIARDMLDHAAPTKRLDRFTLGATLGQCCGGIVELWFERFDQGDLAELAHIVKQCEQSPTGFLMTVVDPTAIEAMVGQRRALLHAETLPEQAQHLSRPNATRAQIIRIGEQNLLIENIQPTLTPLWLYGAGHVGRALVQVLADLPVAITWIDSRADLFPAKLPDHVTALASEHPADEVPDAPAHALHLVMTHRHDFDYAICKALLKHEQFHWAGMIGSETKAASFRARHRRDGFSTAQIERLTCPIGIRSGVNGISSKLPAAIAIAVAAQILQVIETVQKTVQTSQQTTDQDCMPTRTPTESQAA